MSMRGAMIFLYFGEHVVVVVNLYLYTAVVWGGDQGAVHYAFYVSTKSGWVGL